MIYFFVIIIEDMNIVVWSARQTHPWGYHIYHVHHPTPLNPNPAAILPDSGK